VSETSHDPTPENCPPADDSLARLLKVAFVEDMEPSTLDRRAAGGAPEPLDPPGPSRRYEILEQIGGGGMGVVFKAFDRHLGRFLAIKILRERHCQNEAVVRHFLAEARVGARLQHPGLVPVHDLGRFPDGRPFLTMKIVQGQTLADLLQARADLAENLARWLTVFRQVCQTVAYAHAQGVVHRDLKPANIMVGRFGEVVDWGLAKVLPGANVGQDSADRGAGSSGGAGGSDPHSEAGSVKGTPAYMAPEQARGDGAIDQRCDVFGLGAILCEILTGRPPYVAETREAVRRQAKEGDLGSAFARLDACGADPELRDLAKRCLASRPEDRPPNAEAVAEAFAAYRASVQRRLRQAELASAAAEATAAKERQARRLWAALTAALMALALVGGVGAFWILQLKEDRAADVARETDEYLEKAVGFLSQPEGRNVEDALREAVKAEELVNRGGARAETRQRVRDFLADLRLLQALVAIPVHGNYRAGGDDHAEVFRERGFDVGDLKPEDWVRRISSRPPVIAEELAFALDEWALRLRTARPDDPRWHRLLEVAGRVDPDSSRNIFRDFLGRKEPDGSRFGSTDAAFLLRAAHAHHRQPAATPLLLDPRLPDYHYVAKGEVKGTIKSAGSDTMRRLLWRWIGDFQDLHPGATAQVKSLGSETAVPALLRDDADFGPMSRAMRPEEIEQFERKFRYKPTELLTAFDGVAIYVHKDNPIKGLTLRQVDAIFSVTRLGGAAREARTWGELGLTGEWADKPIRLYGRNPASGTYAFFKERALFRSEYKATVKQQPGSSAVIRGVAGDRYAIGYSGIGYKTADVRVVPLAEGDDPAQGVEPVAVKVYTGEYPLARPLYLCVNYQPRSTLDPLRGEFIRFVFSKEGQREVCLAGYFPVTGTLAQKALRSVGLTP
jgi:phosphate binding protein